MENISIKVHPPWYARGTPVINTRDGPPMALSDKPLFAIREGPSARGEPGEGRGKGRGKGRGRGRDKGRGRGKGRGGSPELAVGSWQLEVRSPQLAVGSWQSEPGTRNPDSRGEERSRGEPKGKTRRWLTLKTTFFNTQNSVYSQWCAVLGRFVGDGGVGDADRVCPDLSGFRDAVRLGRILTCQRSQNLTTSNLEMESFIDADRYIIDRGVGDADRVCPDLSGSRDAVRSGEADVDFDLSACGAPDNVNMMNDNDKGLKQHTIKNNE